MEDGHAVYRTMEDGKTPMYLYGPDGLPVTAADLSSLILIDKLKEYGLEGTATSTWSQPGKRQTTPSTSNRSSRRNRACLLASVTST